MLLPSLLRTVVPLVAGWVIVALTSLGFSAGSNTVQSAVTVSVAAVYYIVFRIVERAAEKYNGPAWLKSTAGLLLGYARPPQYKPTDDIAELVRQSRR